MSTKEANTKAVRFARAETGETVAGAAQAQGYLAPLVRQLSEALGKEPG